MAALLVAKLDSEKAVLKVGRLEFLMAEWSAVETVVLMAVNSACLLEAGSGQ